MRTGRKNNRGFTLVEIIIVVAIFTILLGIMAPSLNSILGFRVQRTTGSIGTALDRTKTEAMNRLVGEMELKRKADGYYISYYLDRGKASKVKQNEEEKIAPRNMLISIQMKGQEPVEMAVDESLILTYNREDGSFRPRQSDVMTQDDINEFVNNHQDIVFKDMAEDAYCEKIIVSGGFRTRILTLNQWTGSYDITVG